MLTRRKIFNGKSTVMVAVALVAGVMQLEAEPIQFSGGSKKSDEGKKTAENQKPPSSTSLSSKLFRPYRPLQSVTGLGTFNPQPFITAPQAPTAPLGKHDGEALDRQKNWIFLRPDDEKKSDLTGKALGVRNNSLEPKKSVLTKFLENKPVNDTKEDSDDKAEQAKSLKELLFGPDNEKTKREGQSIGSLQPQLLERDSRSLTISDKPSLADFWNDQNSPKANRLREEKDANMKQFESFFSQNVPASIAPGFGVINGQNPLTAQPLTSVGPGLERFNSSAPLGSLDAVKAAARSSSPAIAALPDVNNRLFGAGASSTRTPDIARPVAQPATLPFPKRHF